ncbi:MAG: peptidoglycan editing factor PgeF [Planctomycetes bacterium]|nr:peptidoglycan editing factor PgeF [Planctomycetota bacterium]
MWLRSPLLYREGFAHAFSTRLGGESPAPFDTMNLGIADAPGESDRMERVDGNWRKLLGAAGIGDRTLVRARQVHGCAVLQADRAKDIVRAAPPFVEGDALLTGDPKQALAIRVADCVPILIADERTRLVAAVHAGWRGVIAQIVPETIRQMRERGSRPQDLRLAIGPCIRMGNFQVGAEVAQEFQRARLAECVAPDPGRTGHWRADLSGAIQLQAKAAGVSPVQIDDCLACTHENPGYFFSYRRDGARGGRLAAVICPAPL